jgi:anti-sigma regulatory factor (Ser/Thr protein kinase)
LTHPTPAAGAIFQPHLPVNAMPVCQLAESIGSCITHERVRLVVPTCLESIDRTVEFLAERVLQLGLPEPARIHRIRIPLHEAITNAIIHGNLEVSSELKEQEDDAFSRAVAERSTDQRYASRTVEVVFDADVHRFQWMITDEGPGFDIAARLAQADSDEVSFLLSGRGITMMRALMDDVYYHLGGRSVIMTMQRSDGESTCRLDSGTRMREIDRVLCGDNDPWNTVAGIPGQCHGPLTATHEAAEISHFDALLDPFLEKLLQTAGEQHEQRQHRRIPFTETITVRDASGETFVAFARDLSHGGISFLSGARFTSPDIELTIPSPDGPVRIQGEIVRGTRLIPTVTDFGVRFVARQAT